MVNIFAHLRNECWVELWTLIWKFRPFLSCLFWSNDIGNWNSQIQCCIRRSRCMFHKALPKAKECGKLDFCFFGTISCCKQCPSKWNHFRFLLWTPTLWLDKGMELLSIVNKEDSVLCEPNTFLHLWFWLIFGTFQLIKSGHFLSNGGQWLLDDDECDWALVLSALQGCSQICSRENAIWSVLKGHKKNNMYFLMFYEKNYWIIYCDFENIVWCKIHLIMNLHNLLKTNIWECVIVFI